MLLEIGGVKVADVAWFWIADDHINVAELDAVLKWVNLALKLRQRSTWIQTNLATTLDWVRSVIIDEKWIQAKGAAEMLVKCYLRVLGELAPKFGLKVSVLFVPSEGNKADILTRG